MPIEQTNPDKPNFVLILILFCGSILVFLTLALIFLKFDGKHLTLRHHSSGPNSSLVMPPTLLT